MKVLASTTKTLSFHKPLPAPPPSEEALASAAPNN